MDRLLAAALLVLALAGCSTTAAPRPGLSADELADRRIHTDTMNWAATGLGKEFRPATPALATVSRENWPSAYVTCMNNAGFDEYVAVEGGWTVGSEQDGPSEAERLAEYICTQSFEIEGQYDDWFNDAEIDYLYAYYREFLVPCLAERGFSPIASPTENEFADNFASWHPYFSVGASRRGELFDDLDTFALCPPTPPGVDDRGLSTLWDRE